MRPQGLSPRRRRVRLTIAALSVTALFGIGLGILAWHQNRPVQYRPDEASADITSDLARQLPPDAPRPKFTDLTHAAGLSEFRNFTGTRSAEMPEDMGPGVAWGDFDNDGDDDLFLVSVGGALRLPESQLQPCGLYENLGDGTFRRFAAFPELRIHGNGAAWGDYDGDGFLDLVVSGYEALLLYRNEGATNGGRRFVRDARLPNPPGFWTGVSWGDYDNDRALDLYVCGYIDYQVAEEDRVTASEQAGSLIPFTLNPASFNGGTNLLFHNQGDGTFVEVGAQLNVRNPEGRSLGALWHDFDEDGWLDLYVANDISDNVFFHNGGGKFEDISHPALVADYRSAMGLAVGDYNRDGDDDLFVSHWVAQENALYDNLRMDFGGGAGVLNRGPQETVPASPSIHTPPSDPVESQPKTLPLRFLDIADRRGLGQIALPYVGWGTEFVDFDGDGWLDLVVANGNTIEADGPPPKKLKAQETLLFWNRRGDFFHNLAPLHAGLSAKHVSRGLAVADFDLDGDMDFIIADLGEGVRLFRNDMQTGHWLKIRLRNRNFLGDAVGHGDGAKVIARVGEVVLRRAVSSVSYLSQSSRTIHFGLGTAVTVDRLEVRWPAGGTNVFEDLDADASYEVTEGNLVPRRLDPPLSAIAHPPPPDRAIQTDVNPARSRPSSGSPLGEKERTLAFWKHQRAAMDALKAEQDHAKAIGFFREALVLNPGHEDSLYYLAACLAGQGDVNGALEQLAELKRVNPQSQRAFVQWGILRAMTARAPADLKAAEVSLTRAHALNPEETGALLVLGEIALLRGAFPQADERLAAACRSNHKAVGGFFLRGYLAWKRGETEQAVRLLQATRQALGPDWQPPGATSEGDVRRKQHAEQSPLAQYWARWDGIAEPAKAYAELDARLRDVGAVRTGSSPTSF